MSRHLIHRAVLLAGLALAFWMTATLALPVAASALSFSGPEQIDTGTNLVGNSSELTSISCPSTSFCAAVDQDGNATVSSAPFSGASAWKTASIDGSTLLEQLGCGYSASNSVCIVEDEQGHELVSTDPLGGASTWHQEAIDPAGGGIGGITCPSASLCSEVDGYGYVLTSRDPDGGASTWTKTAVNTQGPDYGLQNITCPSASFCAADNYNGQVFVGSPGGTWSGAADVDTDGQGLMGISCASASLCVAIDYDGDAFVSTDPAGGASTWKRFSIDASDVFDNDDIACPTTTECVAVDGVGNVITSNHPDGGSDAWSKTSGPVGLYSIACAAAADCVAGSGGGRARLSGGSQSSSPRAMIETGRATVKQGRVSVAVSCVNGGTCRGTLSLSARVKERVAGRARTVTLTLAKAHYSVVSGAKRPVSVKLSAAGLKALRRASGHHLSAKVSATVSGGTTATRTIALKL